MGRWKFAKSNGKEQTESLNSSEKLFTTNNNTSNEFEVFSPENYEKVEIIANTLMLHKSVRVNLQVAALNDRRRIVDFLCGVAYVLNFAIKKIDVNTYEFKATS